MLFEISEFRESTKCDYLVVKEETIASCDGRFAEQECEVSFKSGIQKGSNWMHSKEEVRFAFKTSFGDKS